MSSFVDWKFPTYVIWLFAGWTTYVAYIYPLLGDSSSLIRTAIGELFRLIIFVSPFLLIFRKWFPVVELRAELPSKSAMQTGLIVAIAWASASLIFAIIGLQKQYSGLPDIYFWLTGFSIATVIEEIVFRGYFVNQLLAFGSTAAIGLSSVIFVLIHYPGWLLLGTHATVHSFVTASASIFLLGVVLGILLIKTGSIWPCVMVHAANNLAAVLAGGAT